MLKKTSFGIQNKILLLAISALMALFVYVLAITGKNQITDGSVYASTAAYPANQWANYPGASVLDINTVLFSPIDHKIVNQDGTGGQYNPTVNVAGPHVAFKNDFKLSLQLKDLDGGDATFRVYAGAPVIYDEWRQEPKSIAVTLKDKTATVQIWNGKSESPNKTKSFNIADKDSAMLTLEKKGTSLNILLNGKKIMSVKKSSALKNGNFWLGTDATGNGWVMQNLLLAGDAEFKPALDSGPINNQDSLGALLLTKDSTKFGAAISLYPLLTDQKYRDIALSEFTMWTPENEMKSQFIHPAKDTYTFGNADILVNTALKNNITVHGHALVFGEANAVWMQQTPASELNAVMKDHIATIVGHYKGKVAQWDVVNEPLSDEDGDYVGGNLGFRQNIWYKAMGEQYIADALTAAKAADPSAKLYINDYGLEANGERWDAMIGLLQRLQAKKVPIDGIGFESHVYEAGDHIEPAVLTAHIKQLAAMGIMSRISEIDVHGEASNVQAQQYVGALNACKALQSCMAYSTWGISDKYGSTTSDHTYPAEYGNDLLWDSNFKPKTTYDALKAALR